MGLTMNFYQRTNLSIGLAVLFGFELAIARFFQGKNLTSPDQIFAGISEYWPVMAWVTFQLLFRLKVTIDDHYFFSKENGEIANGSLRFWAFFLQVTSGIFYSIAAVLSFDMHISILLFLVSISLSTAFAALFFFANIEGKKREWLVMNFVCIVAIAGYLCVPADAAIHAKVTGLWLAALFIALGYGVFSEGTTTTFAKMPRLGDGFDA